MFWEKCENCSDPRTMDNSNQTEIASGIENILHMWRAHYRSLFHSAQVTDKPSVLSYTHDDVIKWKHFPRYWPFVRGIYRFQVNSPHKGQWRGALMFSLICVWINGWVNNREAGDLRRQLAHYDVIVMKTMRLRYWKNDVTVSDISVAMNKSSTINLLDMMASCLSMSKNCADRMITVVLKQRPIHAPVSNICLFTKLVQCYVQIFQQFFL